MEIENDALVYSFIEYSNARGNNGPRDILAPILNKSLSSLGRTSFTLEDIHAAIITDFNKDLDFLLLRSELDRFVRNGILKYNVKYRLYQCNRDDIKNYTEEYQYAKEVNERFIRSLKEYIDEKTDEYAHLSFNVVFKHLVNYIEANTSELVNLIGKKKNISIKPNEQEGIHEFIESFIYKKILSNFDLLEAFERIFNGVVLLYVYKGSPNLFNNENPFGEKILFLDTNIIMRVLGLQDSLNNTIGQEFLRYITTPNFVCKITRDTWLELCNLLFGYADCYYKMNKNGNVNHVYQIMKKKNVNPKLIGEFIEEIKAQIEDLNIVIEKEIDIKLVDSPELEDHINRLVEKKYQHKSEVEEDIIRRDDLTTERFQKQSSHDIRNVYNIIYLRHNRNVKASSFETEKYYFVTADFVLRCYVRDWFKHSGLSYTISDSTLAFLLYYRDPENSKGFSVLSFINAHFNSQNLSIINWMEYYDAVKERIDKGQINESQAGYLLSKVILRNDKFEVQTADEIIDNSLNEFEKFETQYSENLSEKNRLEKQNELIFSEMIGVKNEVSDLKSEVSCLKTKTHEMGEVNQTLRSELDNTSKRLGEETKKIRIISIIIFSFGIALFVMKSPILGSLMTAFSVVVFFIELLKSFFKKK